MPQWSKVLTASGVTGLRSLSFNVKALPEGAWWNSASACRGRARRSVQGAEHRAQGRRPGGVRPANATTFQRWRLDLPKAWTALEKMVIDAFPQAGSVLDLMFQTAGKDKDPNYNLKPNCSATWVMI